MPAEEFFASELGAARALAILRGHSPAETVALARRAWGTGIRLVEVPVQSADALRSFEAVLAAGRALGRPVGAGTVTSAAMLERIIDRGARFAVAPGVDERMLDLARDRGLPLLPGVATASDIALALAHGYVWMKAFPAAVLGPNWVRAQLAAFPGARLVATGGISGANAQEYLAAGCAAVAIGSAFASSTRPLTAPGTASGGPPARRSGRTAPASGDAGN